MSKSNNIVVLTCPTPHAWIVINALVAHFGPITVLSEDRQPRRDLIKARIKRQGVVTVVGQVGFILLRKFLDRFSDARIAEIVHQHKLHPVPSQHCKVIEIGSVNSDKCRNALKDSAPDVVLVIGTRIIKRETLESVSVPLINYHAGINPKYRGQAGGYWALAQGDPVNAGVTVHLVDQGVDTGAILYQAPFEPTERDNFSTYFYLQAAAARPLVIKAIEDALEGKLAPKSVNLPSQQFYHPTIWNYLWTGILRGIW